MAIREYSSYIIAFCATIIRYYDYALFGLSSAMISKNFMPGADDADQMLAFFAVFSVAVIARPFGSLVFGKIGDQTGRIASLRIATVIAAVSTSVIAFIPSFSTIGWFAVILLTMCRMMFLISLAGEIDAIKIYVAEKVGKKRRYLANGIVSFSSQIGVLLASIMYHVAISMPEFTWLWKMNFLLGGAFGVVIILLRGHLKESDAFLKSKKSQDVNSGIVEIVSQNKGKFVLGMIVSGMLGGGYYFLVIFLGAFAGNVADIIPPNQATSSNVILISLYGVACVLSGIVADKIKQQHVQMIIALICSIICVLVMEYKLLDNVFAKTLHYMLAFIVPFYSIPCAIKIQSLFETNVRMRMFSLSHSVGSMIFSSTTPFVCMLIWRYSGLFTAVLGYFLLQLMLLLFAIIYIAKNDYESMFET